MIRIYSNLLDKYPLTTKCITSGLMFSLGDWLTQTFIQKQKQVDWRRNLSLTLTGIFYLGPILHVWYSKLLPKAVYKTLGPNPSNFKQAFLGMIYDQMTGPIFLLGFFIFVNWFGSFSIESIKYGWKESKQKLLQTFITNLKVWPAATVFNLMFVPIQYRVLFVNVIGLFWSMYLSYMAAS